MPLRVQVTRKVNRFSQYICINCQIGDNVKILKKILFPLTLTIKAFGKKGKKMCTTRLRNINVVRHLIQKFYLADISIGASGKRSGVYVPCIAPFSFFQYT